MASYVSQQLRPNETILYIAKVHWVVYILPVVILYFSVPRAFAPRAFAGDAIPLVGIIVTLAGLLLLCSAVIKQFTTELAITNERVIAKFGLISRTTSEQQLDRVEGVNLNQSILGRILNYGTITVRGTGGGLTPIPVIKNPGAFQSKLSETLAEIER